MSGIKANSSDKVVVNSGAKWTGICNMKVTMINPTMEEMKKAGMNPNKEPEYFTEKVDNGITRKSYRLDIYLNNAVNKINAKLALFLEPTPRVNHTGDNFQYINRLGQTGWSRDGGVTTSNTFYKMDGSRPAIVGEETLTNFIKAWANVGVEDQAVLENPIALAKGDLTELKSLFATIANNEVQVLLGVKEGKYQDVYTAYFDRPYRKAFDAWKKALDGDYGDFKADFQNDFKLKMYEGGGAVITDTPTDMTSSQTSGGAPYKF